MACIKVEKRKSGTYYYLQETINGKSVKTGYFGKRYPLPRGMPRRNLPDNWVKRLQNKAEQRKIKPEPNPTLPQGKFSVIYADPPWQYDFAETDSRAIENQYSSMPLNQIKRLRKYIPAAENAVLFLWAPAPKLRGAAGGVGAEETRS